MENYIKELEIKAEDLKKQVTAKLSAVDFPSEPTENHAENISTNGNGISKTASVLKYLLLGGGAATLAATFLDRSILRNAILIAVGGAEIAAGVLTLVKTDFFDSIINKSQNTESPSAEQSQKEDLQSVKSKVINIILSLQNDIPTEWDDFLGQKKQDVLQLISKSNLDTAKKSKLNDIAIKRSIIKPVSDNIVSEISKLDETSKAYKTYISDFEKRFCEKIDSALNEQKESAEQISEKLV